MFERIDITSEYTAVMIVFVPTYSWTIPKGLSWLEGFGQVRIGDAKFQKVDSATKPDQKKPYMSWIVRRGYRNNQYDFEQVHVEYTDTRPAGGRQNHLN